MKVKVNITKKDKLPIIIQKMRFKARLEIADEMLCSILDLPDLARWLEFRRSLKV